MEHRRFHAISRALQHRAPIGWALAACLFILVLGAYQYGKVVALHQVERSLDRRMEAHRFYFLDKLGQYSLLPETLATSPFIRNLIRTPTVHNADVANRALSEIAASVDSERIWVIDAGGTTLADSMWQHKDSIIGRNFAYRGYFQQAMAGKTGHFIGVGATSREISYFISRPILVDGKISGVAVIRLSETFNAFQTLLQAHWKERGEFTLVTDENGIIFLTAVPEWTFKSVAPLHASTRSVIRNSRQYGDRDIAPLSLRVGEALSDGMRFVRFAALPQRRFIQKSYDMPESGARTYLYVDAQEYWNVVMAYTGAAVLGTIVIFLSALALQQRWKYQMKLVEAAIHDPLTGLYTRLYMQEWLQDAMDTQARYPERDFTLLLFDVDHFKSINDTHGHVVGDQVLKGIAKIIAGAIRAEDLAVRFGGEEIAVFARSCPPAEAQGLGDRIRQQIEERGVQTTQGHIAVTLSGGIARHVVGESPATLFERADKKLYEAKATGRNCILSEASVDCVAAAVATHAALSEAQE